MKFALVFSTLFVYTLAGTIPEYVPITTYQNSLIESTKSLGTRITNGQVANNNQFPYQVSVTSPVGSGSSVCGGSLISGDWVITACHCTINHRQFNLRFGSLNLWSGGTSLTSFNSIEHPSYNPNTLNNDLALIKLPRTIGLGPSINTVRLPRQGQQSSTFVGVRSTVSGFGATSSSSGVSQILRYVDMRVIANNQCAQTYGSSVVVSHVVCGLGWTNSNNQGHCGGDSGGPLVIQEGNDRTLIGVVSFAATAGCDRGHPSGYMRPGHFLSWIRQHTNIAIRP